MRQSQAILVFGGLGHCRGFEIDLLIETSQENESKKDFRRVRLKLEFLFSNRRKTVSAVVIIKCLPVWGIDKTLEGAEVGFLVSIQCSKRDFQVRRVFGRQ